jgi:protein-tyrosine phosphatase
MTTERKKMLFVCTGNICRSPFAHYLAEHLAKEAGIPVSIESAGTMGEVGLDMEPGAVKALAARGLKGLSHSARQLDEGMLSRADVVYALTGRHRDWISSHFPAHAAKVSVLREAAGLPDGDVADPYGLSDDEYETCAARIEEALKILIRRNPHAEKTR